MGRIASFSTVFFFNDTATTEIYTLSLHDALPICIGGERVVGARLRVLELAREQEKAAGLHLEIRSVGREVGGPHVLGQRLAQLARLHVRDRKSTRLNSSHVRISYAVFCLKKKKNI